MEKLGGRETKRERRWLVMTGLVHVEFTGEANETRRERMNVMRKTESMKVGCK